MAKLRKCYYIPARFIGEGAYVWSNPDLFVKTGKFHGFGTSTDHHGDYPVAIIETADGKVIERATSLIRFKLKYPFEDTQLSRFILEVTIPWRMIKYWWIERRHYLGKSDG